MMLLRNRFFKTCAFNTNLQKWFKDKGITQIGQLGGYTTARKVEDIKLVITESSVKYLKFMPKGMNLGEAFRKWLDAVYEGKNTSSFGVVKTDELHGSYFDVPLGENIFDAAVSVESLHHFTKEEKVALYSRLHTALKNNGYFILTDYFSLSDEEEQMHRHNLLALKAEQGISDNEFYHYDTPLTVKHQTDALVEAGFSSALVLNNWGATYTIKAVK